MTYEMPEKQNFDMLPFEVVDGFEEGDIVLIKAISKDGQKIIEECKSLEKAKNFILTNNRYNPETLKIELVKNKVEE